MIAERSMAPISTNPKHLLQIANSILLVAGSMASSLHEALDVGRNAGLAASRRAQTPEHRETQLVPLLSAVVACRERPAVAAVVPIVSLISEFVDASPRWTIVRACQRPYATALLRRLLAREAVTDRPTDRFYREWSFSRGVEVAAGRGDLEVVKWLCTEYASGDLVVEGATAAAKGGHLHVLKWLHEQYGHIRVYDGTVVDALGLGKLGRLQIMNTDDSPPQTTQSRLEVAQWLIETFGPGSSSQHVQQQIYGDRLFEVADLWFLKYAVSKNLFKNKGKELTFATKAGRLDVVQWFVSVIDRVFRQQQAVSSGVSIATDDEQNSEFRFKSDSDHEGNTVASFSFPYRVNITGGVGQRYLDTIKWLHEVDYPWMEITATADTMVCAAGASDLEVVQWLHENRTEGCTTEAMVTAASSGHLHVVRWLHENQTEGCTSWAMDSAAQNNHFDIVDWLRKNRTEGCATHVMDSAASHGHLDVVRWLHENHAKGCTQYAMEGAAANGHLDVVQFLHLHRREGCSTSAMSRAIVENHLPVVQWLHKHRSEGCTAGSIATAAGQGNLPMIQWLTENGVDGFTSAVMDKAALNGHLAVVQWLHDHRSEGCTTKAMDGAASNGHLAVVQWLHDYRSEGCTIKAMDKAAGNGHLDVVQWLHANRAEGCSTAAMESAATSDHFEVLLFLHANRSEGCTGMVLSGVCMHGRRHILRWLIFNYPHMFDQDSVRELSTHVLVPYNMSALQL